MRIRKIEVLSAHPFSEPEVRALWFPSFADNAKDEAPGIVFNLTRIRSDIKKTDGRAAEQQIP
jgi:hypothetical protein